MVKISKVDAKVSFTIGLLNENHVCQLGRVVYFSDGLGMEKLVDLLIDCLLTFWGKNSSLLFNGLASKVHTELVCDD